MAEQEPSTERSQENLELENERLKKEIEARDEEIKNRNSFNFWVGKKIGGVFLGWQLKDSIHRLFGELTQGKVTQKTLADVTSHALWRFTRIGLFAIFAAIIPVVFLAVQTRLLAIQNAKIEAQNQKIEAQSQRMVQQTYLQEAERRSSQVFLFSNVQDKIDDELKNPLNINNSLSDQTVGRIVALSLALKPYRYLENDTLIKTAVSPERAQLLVSLTNIELDTSTLLKIFRRSDYSRAELNKAKLSYAFLQNINLRNAVLTEADLSYANMIMADLSNADLRRINLKHARLSNANLSGSIFNDIVISTPYAPSTRIQIRTRRLVDPPIQYIVSERLDSLMADRNHVVTQNPDLSYAQLNNAQLIKAYLRNVVLKRADLRNANLSGAILINTDLRNAKLNYAKLNDALLNDANLDSASLFKIQLKNANLRGASLNYVNLKNSVLVNADLRNADLSGADLSNSNLRGANLSYANLKNVNLANADLRDIDLSEADLMNVTLEGANLENARVSRFKLKGKPAQYIKKHYNILKSELFPTIYILKKKQIR